MTPLTPDPDIPTALVTITAVVGVCLLGFMLGEGAKGVRPEHVERMPHPKRYYRRLGGFVRR